MPIRKVGSDTPISDTVCSTLARPVSRIEAGIDAHRHADEQREQRGAEGELQRRRQALGDQRLTGSEVR